MNTIQEYQQFLHSDPETLPGVPSDEAIAASNPGVSDITVSERVGFLQIWRMGQLRRHMNDLPVPELTTLRGNLNESLGQPNLPEVIDELRLLQGIAAIAIGKVN